MLQRAWRFRKPGSRLEGVLELRHRFADGRAVHRPLARLLQVVEGLVPDFRTGGVMREEIDLFVGLAFRLALHRLDDAAMDGLPAGFGNGGVGGVADQGVLEGEQGAL